MKWIASLALVSLVLQSGWAKSFHVGSGFPYDSIHTAIREASAGDSIFVHAGFYQEGNIIVNKSVYLAGIDWPVIDGNKKYEVLSVKADHAVITGLQIQNSGHASLDDPCGIKVYDSRYVEIRGNRLVENYFGIYLQYSQHCIVRDNEIKSSGTEELYIGNGIHCWKSDSLQIIHNTISGHRDGIYFEFVTGSVIWRNISTGNVRYGLHFMFSHNDAYITNLFEGNGAGVAVMFTKNVKMFNNYFRNNWGDAAYGILLKEISDSYIFNNDFEKNTTGIMMEGTSRIRVEQNRFKNNGWAMKIQASCMDNDIIANNFMSNT
ncbi:MAG TPA: nitrous oxide reductase family maturation protein NosD, partial [Saprospiraceae bacterium]|nr:nitrous oxide reductase family maturation protein NosD [Saprospiraceae bacterium]